MSDKSGLRDSASGMTRRRFLGSAAWTTGAIATGAGSWAIRPAWGAATGPIKVGIATDLTGAIGYAGNANANIAKLAMKEINAKGGILGRPIELYIEDTASNEATAVANVRKLIQRDKVDVVFDTVIPPGVGPFFKQLYKAGFTKRGGRLSCVYYDENTLNINAPHEIEGLASCLDYFRAVTKDEPGSARIQAEYDKQFPGNIVFAAGSAATGMYRGLKLWQAAVTEARSVDREAVAKALDHAKISEGPGGPAEMVPGKRHCKMRMYTAVAKQGTYDIVARSKGLVDPKEC